MKHYLTLMIVAGGLVACGGEGKKAGPIALASVPVEQTEAAAVQVPVLETVVGTVRPKLEATVSAKISGRILELLVVPGQRVAAGERLAVLEAGELEAARNRAAAALDQAGRELERQRQLLASNATSRAMFEQAEAAQKMAAASLAEITTTLKQAEITAPFAGIVSRKMVDTGDLAVPGRGIIQLEDPTKLRLEAAVPESIAGSLKIGQSIPVTLDAAKENPVATVSELAPSADSTSRTFMVKMDLPESSKARVGLFGRAHFPLGERAAVLIPAAAVKRTGQMETVFLIDNGKAVLRLVRTVKAGDGKREVLAGLAAGAVVVVNPPVTLVDGQPVTSPVQPH